MHYQTDRPDVSITDEPSAADVLEQLIQHYSTSGTGMEKWLATMPTSAKLTEVRVYEELAATDTGVPEAASEPYESSGAIGVADANLPTALCAWVKFGTGLASRSSRGGTHLSPTLDQNHLGTDGLWDTSLAWWAVSVSLANAMKDRLEDVLSSGLGDDIDLVPIIYSRTRRAAGLDPFTFEITSASVSPVPRWLRRRDVGR